MIGMDRPMPVSVTTEMEMTADMPGAEEEGQTRKEEAKEEGAHVQGVEDIADDQHRRPFRDAEPGRSPRTTKAVAGGAPELRLTGALFYQFSDTFWPSPEPNRSVPTLVNASPHALSR